MDSSDSYQSDTTPRSGWLGERGRLKGGHLLSLGVARKRAFVNDSELCVCSIRGFLLADVLDGFAPGQGGHARRRSRKPRDSLNTIPLVGVPPGIESPSILF